MKLLIANNLGSGLGDGAIYDFARSFARDSDEIVIRSTDGTTDLRTLLADADAFDLVVASGGDGTVATICYMLADTGIPVLPYPAGTANLLALNLQSPTEAHALAKLARTGKPLDFDLGEIEIGGGSYGFGIMAGAGYDADIMSGAEQSKRYLGPLAYFSAAIGNPLPQRSMITVETDEETVTVEGIGVLVINFSKIQFDISVTHGNNPRDGLLDIAVLITENAFGLIPALGAALLDREGGFPDRAGAIKTLRTKHARIEADPPLVVQYDGEITNVTTPFSVRVLPKAARLLVSDEGYELFAED